MTWYAADCYELGFVCEWQAQGDTKPATVTALLEHINSSHDTGTTSEALKSLLAEVVFVVDEEAPPNGGSRRNQTVLQRQIDRLRSAFWPSASGSHEHQEKAP